MDDRRQVALTELRRREVDGDLQRLRPGRRFAAGLPQNPFADRDDQTALLDQRDKDIRRYDAAARMLPPDQRLEADDLASDQCQGLIVQDKFVFLECG